MAGINALGNANADDYVIGRGRVFFAPTKAAGRPEFRFLGNCPAFGIRTSAEEYKHFSSITGIKSLDKRVVISQEMGVTFTLEELNFKNLADFVSGDVVTGADNGVKATQAEFQFITAGATTGIAFGVWYELRDDDDLRVYDIPATSTITVKEGAVGASNALTYGTDYEIDLVYGMIRFFDTAALDAADGITLAWSQQTSQAEMDQVTALTKTRVEGQLKVILENAAVSPSPLIELHFHAVSLAAEGDAAIFGDEAAQLQFTGACERDENGDTATISYHANAAA